MHILAEMGGPASRLGAAIAPTAIVCALVAGACRQLVGIGDEPPKELAQTDASTADASPRDAAADADARADGGGSCGITYAPAACEACLQSACCTQAAACANDTACSALEGCLGPAGGDPARRASCVRTNLIGVNTAEEGLSACLAASCAHPCGLDCGGIAGVVGPDAATACQSCAVTNTDLCNAATTCLSDPACVGWLWCILGNVQQDRQQACESALDAAADAATALRRGAITSCQAQCGLGDQWFCVGHPTSPPQPNPTTTVAVSLYENITQKPVPGVRIEGCSQVDHTCGTVLSNATTDDAGSAILSVTRLGTGPGASGYLLMTDGGIAPEIAYWGYPLSEPTINLSVPVLTEPDLAFIESQLGGVVIDQSRALVTVAAYDCDGFGSPGVTFTIDPSDSETKLFYIDQSTFGFTPDASTDPSGLALFVNVLVPSSGVVQVTATPAALTKASSVEAVVVRPNTITVVPMAPNQ